MMKRFIQGPIQVTVIGGLLCLGILFIGQLPSYASEGGSSYYFPGAFASFGVAVPPDSGFQFVNQTLYYHGNVDKTVLNGHVGLSLKATAIYNYFGGSYVPDATVLGGRLQVFAAVPVGYVYTKAGISLDVPSYISISHEESDHAFNIGDSLLSGALAWKTGDFSFKVTEMVFVPTGAYSTDDLANLGRNYWGFDTSCAATWLSSKTGTEISVMPGILFNTENDATDYKTGNEFHMDFMLNQFLAKNFALGAQGYYYKQVTGDSESGAKLGDFKGESCGFGPALLWQPGFDNGKLTVIGKWIFDSHRENRMKGDYGQLLISKKF
jgi:hypothetical protein